MLADVVKELRNKTRFTAQELALKVGRNKTYVTQIEQGAIKHPHLPSLKKILTELGCTSDEIDEIILNEFHDLDVDCKKSSLTKTAYIMEKKIILNKKKEQDTKIDSFQGKILTRKAFEEKCELDALRLYDDLKKLPKATLDLLVNLLYEDI